jgi:hypothetical protein
MVTYTFGWTPTHAVYPAEVLSYQSRAKGLALVNILNKVVSCINTFGWALHLCLVIRSCWQYILAYLSPSRNLAGRLMSYSWFGTHLNWWCYTCLSLKPRYVYSADEAIKNRDDLINTSCITRVWHWSRSMRYFWSPALVNTACPALRCQMARRKLFDVLYFIIIACLPA